MKKIRQFMMLCVILVASSFVGVAVTIEVNPTNGVCTIIDRPALGSGQFEILPVVKNRGLALSGAKVKKYPTSIPGMGNLDAVREYRAVTGTDLAVNCFQSDDNGDDLFLVPISEYRTFKSYADFLRQLKEMMTLAATKAMLPSNKAFDPSRPVNFFFGSGTYIDLGPDDYFLVGNFFGRTNFIPVLANGTYVMPPETLEDVTVQISRDLGWMFDFPVLYVKLLGRKEGQEPFTRDSTKDASEHYGYTRSGDLYLEDRFYLNGRPEGSEDVKIQLTFDSGVKLIFDGNGNLVTPTIGISPTSSAVLVSVLNGMFDETYTIGSTTDFANWQYYEIKVTVSENKLTFPITNDSRMFQLK
jgi:hypothetical protein